jgi:heme exporter protein A
VRRSLAAEGITKSFGTRPVLRSIDLEVEGGETVAMFGPNGAGKTTLIYILATLLRPNEGVVKIDGKDWRKSAHEARRQIGLLCHRPQLYSELTARENLEFYAGIYGVAERRVRVNELLKQFSLAAFADEPVRIFSQGMTQRLSLARALIHDAPILLLDEPFAGVDASGREIVCNMMDRERARGKAILFVSHDLELAHRQATRLLLLHHGKLARTFETGAVPFAEVEAEYERCISSRGEQATGR